MSFARNRRNRLWTQWQPGARLKVFAAQPLLAVDALRASRVETKLKTVLHDAVTDVGETTGACVGEPSLGDDAIVCAVGVRVVEALYRAATRRFFHASIDDRQIRVVVTRITAVRIVRIIRVGGVVRTIRIVCVRVCGVVRTVEIIRIVEAIRIVEIVRAIEIIGAVEVIHVGDVVFVVHVVGAVRRPSLLFDVTAAERE